MRNKPGGRLGGAGRIRPDRAGDRPGPAARARRRARVPRRSAASPHTPDRPVLEDMDRLPFVTPVYKRDLTVENYAIGYLRHPYVSLYTGRGCRSKCTFCLWPQTVGGQRYRTRSVGHVAEEMAQAVRLFPQVREFFFDDDTFTDDLPRAEAIARRLGPLGITWSVNAKANVPHATLKVLKDNGLRLLLVGYESGSQADPEQREEGRAARRGAPVHAGGEGARHHHPRDVHPGAARGDARDHRRDHPLRARDRSRHDPGLARRAVSRHRALRGGAARTAGSRTRRPRGRGRASSRAPSATRTCREPRSSGRSTSSTAASTSGRAR